MGWTDNNAVMALTTVHTVNEVTDEVERNRRRPAGKSTGAKNARKAFDGARQVLPIPRTIDDYNHFMGGVDIADQYRSIYATQRRALRIWWPMFYWALDQAIINAYLVGCQLKVWKPSFEHKDFRKQLFCRLLAFSTEAREKREEIRLGTKRWDTSLLHESINTGSRKTCAWCAYLRKEVDPSERNEHASKQAPRTPFQCSQCAVPLCSRGSCFEDYHRLPADSEVASEV